MTTSYMTHDVKGISEVTFDPTNSNVLSFTLNYHNGDHTTLVSLEWTTGLLRVYMTALVATPRKVNGLTN